MQGQSMTVVSPRNIHGRTSTWRSHWPGTQNTLDAGDLGSIYSQMSLLCYWLRKALATDVHA